MSALKVGDRVHVEFDGVIRYSSVDPDRSGFYVERADRWQSWVLREHLTKLPEPEPEWCAGDVVVIPTYNHDEGITLVRDRRNKSWITNYGTTWTDLEGSVYWQRDEVQRLVPEAQK